MIHSTSKLRLGVESPPAKDEFHLISVVIPCLNEELTIGRCIEKAREGCQMALQSQNSRGFGGRAKYEIIVDIYKNCCV
jgi:hypothetical protein